VTPEERLRRWRLLLGGGTEKNPVDGIGISLTPDDLARDRAMQALYGGDDDAGSGGKGGRGGRGGGLGASSPNVARWLGDIRTYFPTSVVQVMQKDAIERLNLHRLLLEPELLSSVEPDINLVGTLMSLNGVLPQKSKGTARLVVRRVTDQLMRRLEAPMRQAVTGALARSVRNRRPRHNEIDWHRTIRANLQHYQEDYKTIVPETRIGHGRKRTAMREIIVCMDQSGSMASSIVYAGIFGCVLASLPSVRTRIVAFDTAVVDLTDKSSDPVDILFGVQLGGGTDIARALEYCQSHITRPTDTIFVLITDLIEGGDNAVLLKRAASIVASGAQLITLLALSDEGKPCYDDRNAAAFAALGIPCFACTPDKFPDLMAAAISRRDINAWAAQAGMVTTRSEST
jgi:Mg-chelatase subunit ChlD